MIATFMFVPSWGDFRRNVARHPRYSEELGTRVARSFGMAHRAATRPLSPRMWLGQKRTGGLTHVFSRLANRISEITGSHWAFLLAASAILAWLVTGPLFGFSD